MQSLEAVREESKARHETQKQEWVWTGQMKSKIVVAGGTNNFGCLKTVECWEWGEKCWTRLPDMMTCFSTLDSTPDTIN